MSRPPETRNPPGCIPGGPALRGCSNHLQSPLRGSPGFLQVVGLSDLVPARGSNPGAYQPGGHSVVLPPPLGVWGLGLFPLPVVLVYMCTSRGQVRYRGSGYDLHHTHRLAAATLRASAHAPAGTLDPHTSTTWKTPRGVFPGGFLWGLRAPVTPPLV